MRVHATIAVLLVLKAAGTPSLRGAVRHLEESAAIVDEELQPRRTGSVSARGLRLCEGGVTKVYHQTDMAACRSILESGFDLAYSSPGNLGMGIYFADSAERTGWKTRHWGCVIEVAVRLGNPKALQCNGRADGCEGGWTWLPERDQGDPDYGSKLNCLGHDSLYTYKHGFEESIFFTDQVVDMIAYPTCTWYGCHRRNGPYLNGRSQLNIPSQCSANDFPDHCNSTGTITTTSATETTQSSITMSGTSETISKTSMTVTTTTLSSSTETSSTDVTDTFTTITSATSTTATCAPDDCSGGYQPLKQCQCNEQCRRYGNCCSNYQDICSLRVANSTSGSCARHDCWWGYQPHRPCQCNSRCREFGNCCSNYVDVC